MDIAWTAVVLVTLLVGGVAGAGYLLHPGTQSSGSSAHFVPLVQLAAGHELLDLHLQRPQALHEVLAPLLQALFTLLVLCRSTACQGS